MKGVARAPACALLLIAVALQIMGLLASREAAANFGWVNGIAADAQGNLYVGDRTGRRILRLAPSGEYTTVAVSRQTLDPWALAVDRAGTLYAVSPDLDQILRITAYGRQSIIPLGKPGFAPAAVATDDKGNVYVAGQSRHVLKITLSTGATRDFVVPNSPGALAIDSRGNIYVGSPSGPPVMLTPEGSRTSFYCGECSSHGVAVDRDGNLYISDAYRHRVLVRGTSGDFIPYAGIGKAGFSGDGGPASAAALDFPTSLAVDGDGRLFIFDYLNNAIRKVSNGVITTVTTPE